MDYGWTTDGQRFDVLMSNLDQFGSVVDQFWSALIGFDIATSEVLPEPLLPSILVKAGNGSTAWKTDCTILFPALGQDAAGDAKKVSSTLRSLPGPTVT